MATERFMPVERSEGSRWSMPATPTISSRPLTTCIIWSSCMSPRSRRGKATFSPTEMESNRAPFWKTMVTLRRMAWSCFSLKPVMSSPATLMVPESGLRKPSSICSETDLPTPERPRMQRVSPGLTKKFTFLRTSKLAKRFRDIAERDEGAGLVVLGFRNFFGGGLVLRSGLMHEVADGCGDIGRNLGDEVGFGVGLVRGLAALYVAVGLALLILFVFDGHVPSVEPNFRVSDAVL